jgi:nucleotide-binding universal stress UspA family protein
VPYDGSEPASAALAYGIGFAAGGAELVVVNVVDDLAVMAQLSSEGPWPVDRSPLLAALDVHARSVLSVAKRQAAAAHIEPHIELVHDVPVTAIAEIAKSRACDLVVMGTHARTGLSRLFLGSTTAGVLRVGEVPVLSVRRPPAAGGPPAWKRILVAVDDSDPADAALRLAGRISAETAANLTLCHAVNTDHTREMAAQYGYDPSGLVARDRAEGRAIVERAAARAALAPGHFETAVVEGGVAPALAAAAAERHPAGLLLGSHGRRGLQRLMLGSVAEHLVRTSPAPVLVVRI